MMPKKHSSNKRANFSKPTNKQSASNYDASSSYQTDLKKCSDFIDIAAVMLGYLGVDTYKAWLVVTSDKKHYVNSEPTREERQGAGRRTVK